jgi:putative FmdB family regulatory protein
MPIYEYRCEHCGDFEEMQRITDAPLTRCPRCRRKVRRLISQTSFQLKGTGWYVTDYGRSGNGGKKPESGAEAKADTKADSKSDAKSETKSESKSATGASEKPAS